MYIIVVGCGRVGSELAYRLHKRGNEVAIIDHVGASFSQLHPDYRGRTIEAEVLSEHVLERAGIETADGLAAVTNSDAVNAVVGHVARDLYGVRNVVVRNYSPRWLPMHDAFALQVVSSTAWGALRIEELLHKPLGRAVFSAGSGEVEIYEMAVPPAWSGKSLADLVAGTEARPVALTRSGRSRIPVLDVVLEEGDVLYVSATRTGIEALRRLLVTSSR